MSADPIHTAKERLPLPSLLAQLGLAEHAKKSAFCPLHENTRSRAFSVFQNDKGAWLWTCFAGCGSGDEITFLEKLSGLTRKTAIERYLAMAGIKREAEPVYSRSSSTQAKPSFPDMGRGTPEDIQRLAALRCLSTDALLCAQSAGLLCFATLHPRNGPQGHRAWIVTDDERINAQARRLDGQPWEHIAAKAWTLPGSRASWPLGVKAGSEYLRLLLVEGGPDLLAAIQFLIERRDLVTWFPIAMLGAHQNIAADALPYFANKAVRIFPHADEAGDKALARWCPKLRSVGCTVDAFSFEGLRRRDDKPVKDLNDAIVINADGRPELEELLP